MVTPKGFFPQEDIGQLSVSTEARQDISFEAMIDLQKQVEDVFRRSPHVANVANIVGSSKSGLNAGRMFVELKPATSGPSCSVCFPTCAARLSGIAGINTYVTPVQNLRIGGRSSRAEYQFVMQTLDRPLLYEWSQKMADAMSRDRHLPT